MTGTQSAAWRRWRRFAERAAAVQAAALLWLLYYVVLVPIAFVRSGGRLARRRDPGAPTWHARIARTTDLQTARRQF